jgi:2-phosphosulfolactate phosphatase
MRSLRVHFLSELVASEDLGAVGHTEGRGCVVIDVLRATTTIVAAVAAGARRVVPFLSVEAALEARRVAAREACVLAGERGGWPIDGFDLGNSPAEYTSATVGGRTVLLTTTNGTKALLHARSAGQVIIGAFVNLSAVCTAAADLTHVDLLCAGTDGQITREDVLFAGAVVARLTESPEWQPNDAAVVARDAWLQVAGGRDGDELRARLVAAMRASRGGRNLIEIGMAGDIDLAAEIDRYAIVPRYFADRGEITL